jgi:hypothetical protein
VTSLVTVNIGHIGYVLSRPLIGLISRGEVKEAEVILRKYYTWTMGAFALPVAILFVHADMLFVLWLGDYGESLGDLLRIGLMSAFLVDPIAMVNGRLLASNRVALNGVASLLMGPALLGLGIALAKGLDWGVAGIVAAGGFVLLGRNIGLLVDAWHNCGLSLKGLARGFGAGLLAFAGVVLISYGRARIIPLTALSGLASDFVLGTAAWAAILWRVSPDCRFLAQGLARRLIINPGAMRPVAPGTESPGESFGTIRRCRRRDLGSLPPQVRKNPLP